MGSDVICPEPVRPVVLPLEWGHMGQVEQVMLQGPFDYILGSDVVYNYNLHESFLKTLRSLLARNGQVVLAVPLRGEDDMQFLTCAQECGWDFMELVERDLFAQGSASNVVRILRARHPEAD